MVTNELVTAWRDMGPAAWAESEHGWLVDGQPAQLNPWQRAVLLAWWKYRGECTTLALSNAKKTGKTWTNAVITGWRWLALPGQHFAGGNDLDQASSRVFSEVAEMVKRHPYLRAHCKIGRNEIEFIPTGSKLTALAADATGNAGANFLTASTTEAWGILYEAGIRAFEELTPPPGKWYGFPALRVVDSYAGFESESQVWHGIVDRGLKGDRIDPDWPIYRAGGLVLFHMEGEEARARCFRGTPEEAAAYYADQQATLRPNAFTRMHGNQRTSGEAAFITPEQWEACYSPDVRPVQLHDSRRMILGADASTSHDLTALVGCAYNERGGAVEAAYVKVWKPARIAGIRFGKPTVDLVETIGAEVKRLHAAGQVAAVVADPYQLHTLILDWQKAGIRVIELAQNAGRVEADQALYTAIIGRTIRHFNEPTLNEHMKNAVAVETVRGFRLAKEKTSLKIDAAVALSMSHWGALDRMNQGETGAIPNPFYIWPPPDDAAWHPVYGYVFDWNFAPHPAGVTWQNCKHRNKGCAACEEELREAGFYDEQARGDARATDGETRRQERASLAEAQRKASARADEQRQKVLDTFNQMVKGVKR